MSLLHTQTHMQANTHRLDLRDGNIHRISTNSPHPRAMPKLKHTHTYTQSKCLQIVCHNLPLRLLSLFSLHLSFASLSLLPNHFPLLIPGLQRSKITRSWPCQLKFMAGYSKAWNSTLNNCSNNAQWKTMTDLYTTLEYTSYPTFFRIQIVHFIFLVKLLWCKIRSNKTC